LSSTDGRAASESGAHGRAKGVFVECLLFGDFLLAMQEKVTRPPGEAAWKGRMSHAGCGVVPFEMSGTQMVTPWACEQSLHANYPKAQAPTGTR
jgi:hypothetical protein